MNRSTFLAVLLAAVVVLAGAFAVPRSPKAPSPRSAPIALARGTEDDPNGRDEMEFMMLRDPRTNSIPWNIRQRELAFIRSVPTRDLLDVTNQAEGGPVLAALTWNERGPNNVGGRTRAFAIDVANPTNLLAGSVAGGIWKSTDDGASWSLRTPPAQIHGTTCIAQDRRSGKTNLWYVGTGELRGSTTNDTRWGSLYRGDGIFKSTDSGNTWTLLPSTSSGTPQTTDAFDWIVNVATNPAAPAGQDHVLAATHNGIQRSTDGGGTWTQVIASDSGYTDVAITSTGVSYAFTRTASAPRIRRSTDGVTWTSIAPASFPAFVNRIVIGLAPSNPNVVYFFVQGVPGGPSPPPQVAGHQLWKYTYVSGNGSGAGGTWENRGGNLPVDIFAQGGYDMVVQVKPNDANFVLIGGTNLYRSTDGFATSFSTTIGGYPYWPDLNHHPDMHSGGFSPANANVYYSANDGGVQKTANVTAAEVAWTSLNHGYNVTQFYSVSIAPEAGSNWIMAGAQDNGTQLGTAPGASDWTMVYGGDGTVVEVAPLADDRIYTQWQNGNLQRHQRDGTGYAELTPDGAVNQLFVNPIAFDPNNSSLLYYPAGTNALPVGTSSRIWRNDAAPVADEVTGWTHLATTDVGGGGDHVRRISALGLSTANAPNVLYYGTTDGIVMRADGANGSPIMTDITPPGLQAGSASGGFVRCIAVDPENSNHAVLAFGNYNFPSLWETTDGGLTWTDVEGNLAGPAGPSVRWVSMFRAGGVLYVVLGTSVGVLSTTTLAGGSTVWAQEATSEIGNVLIAYMDYRASDRTLAIGTHARGVFTTQFPASVAVHDGPASHGRVTLAQSYPNPARHAATIAYELPHAQRVSLRVYDVAGREVATLVDAMKDRGRHEARFDATRAAGGVYYYVLRTASGVERKQLLLVK